MELLISLITGALGGNIAGGLVRKADMGVLVNSAMGVLGGGLGAQILTALALGGAAPGGTDTGAIISQIAAGGAGGGALLLAIGLIRNAVAR